MNCRVSKISMLVDSKFDVYAMIGNPVKQTKTPLMFNTYCKDNAIKSVMVPICLKTPLDLASFVKVVQDSRLIKGFVSTIPYKPLLANLVSTLTPRASQLGAVNTVRFSDDGALEGDMFDGLGLVNGLVKKGCVIEGRTALILGAGAAGRAISLALKNHGIERLHVVDPDEHMRLAALKLIGTSGKEVVTYESAPELAGYDVIINASPLGMNEDDPLPVALESIKPQTWVADCVTNFTYTSFLKAAKERECFVQTGQEMAAGQLDLILDFFSLKAV